MQLRDSRRRWAFVLAFAALGAVATGWGVYQYKKFQHFAVHHKGMVYRSAWLEPAAFNELIEEYQIRSIVNLCKPGEMGEARWEAQRDVVRNAGARLIELEMPKQVEVDAPLFSKHLDVLADPNNYPMLVHCQHGVTRTAKFLSMYDIKFRRMSAVESLQRQPLFGREGHNVNVRAFVMNFEREHETAFPRFSAAQLRSLAQ